jgi:TfoX/Sxy family transcriptional regulator of competence genes
MATQPALQERVMFGGVGFLIRGNMACGVHGDKLIIRVGSKKYEDTLKRPYTRPFDLNGRPMSGWVFVEEDGYSAPNELKNWVMEGVEFALTLKAK